MGGKAGDRRGAKKQGVGRRWLRRLAVAVLAVLLILALQHQHVLMAARDRVWTEAEVPPREAILVLGARIHGGRPSSMLIDRLRTAANLYQLGKAPRVVVSGDGRARDYDEVAAMSRWLVEDGGVPRSALIEDRAGLRTLDSMVRAGRELELDGVIVVTNPFHVARAVFLGVQHGLDAVGVAAPHGHAYGRRVLWGNRGREILARIWAWWDVFALGTEPAVRGPAPAPR